MAGEAEVLPCVDCEAPIPAVEKRCVPCFNAFNAVWSARPDCTPSRLPLDSGPVETGEMSLAVFRERCAAMRDERVSKAWGIELELPPAPVPDDSEETTQRPTAAQAEQRAREERRRVALAAGGGPRRRVDQL